MNGRRLAAALLVAAASVPLLGLPTSPATAAGCSTFFDANADGFDDLVVGVPGEDVSVGGLNRVDAGSVTVVYGDAAGTFGSHGSEAIAQETLGLVSTAGAKFGAAVVTADLNGDGCADLAIGVPGEQSGAGAVVVVSGSPTGLLTGTPQVLRQGTPPLGGAAEPKDGFGTALAAAGSLPTGGAAALWVGSPGEDVGSLTDIGMISELDASPGQPLGAAGVHAFHENSPKVPGLAVRDDRFGERLSGGERTLLIGVPHKDVAGLKDAGSYVVFNVAARAWRSENQDSTGIPGAAEPGDRFGSSVAHAEGCQGATDETWVIGASGEDIGTTVNAGTVTLRDRLSGHSTALQQGSGVIPGVPAASDGFGATAVAAGALVIGSPGDDVGTAVDTGIVTLVDLGCSGGTVVAESARAWSQSTTNVPGARATGNAFGASLGASLVAVSGLPLQYRLVVGSRGETDGTAKGAGRVTVFGTNSLGLTTNGASAFGQSSPGIADDPETGDGFGGSLDAGNATAL